MKPIRLILFFTLFSFTFLSCSGDSSNSTDNPSGSGVMYLGGIDQNNLPVVYKGNERLQIDTQGKEGLAIEKIHKNGNDLFLSAFPFNGFWKNGVFFKAIDYCQGGTVNTQFDAIAFKGSDVYISGKTYGPQVGTIYTDTIKIWKNGILIHKKHNREIRTGTILQIDDSGSIYFDSHYFTSTSGTFGNYSSSSRIEINKFVNGGEITLWSKNQSRYNITRTTDHYWAFSMHLTNDGIFTLLSKQLSGGASSVNSLEWISNFEDFSTYSLIRGPQSAWLEPRGTFYTNNTMYTSTIDNMPISAGKYWVNDESFTLFQGLDENNAFTGHVGNIEVHNNDIYVAGREKASSSTLYFKNGIPVTGPENFKCLVVKFL